MAASTVKEEPMKTYNHDCAGVLRRVHRFTYELYKSVSASGAFVNEFDKKRWNDYLDAIDKYLDHVVSQPQIDAPESHPREIIVELLPDETINSVENESIIDGMYYLKLACIEVAHSQSSRMAAGLLPFDEARCRALVSKARNLLQQYVEAVQPLDLPESSPARVISGSGLGGI
jgi:hypothetical protein